MATKDKKSDIVRALEKAMAMENAIQNPDDDSIDPAVRAAARQFLRENPGYKELSDEIARLSIEGPGQNVVHLHSGLDVVSKFKRAPDICVRFANLPIRQELRFTPLEFRCCFHEGPR